MGIEITLTKDDSYKMIHIAMIDSKNQINASMDSDNLDLVKSKLPLQYSNYTIIGLLALNDYIIL